MRHECRLKTVQRNTWGSRPLGDGERPAEKREEVDGVQHEKTEGDDHKDEVGEGGDRRDDTVEAELDEAVDGDEHHEAEHEITDEFDARIHECGISRAERSSHGLHSAYVEGRGTAT
jgi:hypothetical protein